LDRAALRRRRQQAGEPDAEGANPPRPFVVRFRPSNDRPFGVSLSFRTDAEPEPRDVIAALRTIIEEIEASLE
ncbi:MAG: hypothetical protein PVG53_01155, partial [Holophagae bacterium]